MPKLRICRLFSLLPAHRAKVSDFENLSSLAVMCVVVFCAAGVTTSPAQSVIFTTVHSFQLTDGYAPLSALIRGADGNFYGTTQNGGDLGCGQGGLGCGTVFAMAPSGALATLYSFQAGSDGAYPYAAQAQGTDGNFYGTTTFGGDIHNCIAAPGGCGTVFGITPSGTLTTLHSFEGTDGEFPYGGLVQASDGNLYGTTFLGGDLGCQQGLIGCGTVFQITPSGTLTTLHNFEGRDGWGPWGWLIEAGDGNLYGTTGGGGSAGYGTVFRITLNGTLTTLHSFDFTDGYDPYAGLVQGTDGNFYGTTEYGGNYGCNNGGGDYGCGTVFKITPNGTLTTLYSFHGSPDGAFPIGGLVQGTDGNFYGTTEASGPACCGTVFKVTPSGTLTTLHGFEGVDDGGNPWGGLVQVPNGFFYGTTISGGTYHRGTAFRLAVVQACATCRP